MLTPLRDLVLIERDSEKEKTDGGLILLKHDREAQDRGIVKAFGKQVSGIKKGDRVIFWNIATHEVKDDLVLVKQKHLMGVVK